MKAGADRLKALVENMLVLSRLEGQREVESEPILVHRVIEQVVARYRAEHPRRTFTVGDGTGVPVVLGEATSVEQVLDNLISNAVKYSPEEAPIEVETAVAGGFLEVSVCDRGPGIEEGETIFEPFHRSPAGAAAAPGLGLGLTVCQRLVGLLGGSIRAEPRTGGGSRFTFTLPLLPDEG
jgi:signal transduction histidine kinase